MKEKIVLIDGHSILNRAFYGLPDLTNSEGLHTNAVYGFLNMMFRILEEEKPQYLAVAFDLSAPTFRHKMYQEYKGTRKAMPQELREQVPLIKDVLKAMGVLIVEQEGFEADDILGTIARKSEADGMQVTIVSGDRDLLQLATDEILIRIPKTKGGKTSIEDYHAKEVLETYQVSPKQIIELKALMGDSADNIPGIPGVGEKTAAKLIAAYGSIENAYEHVEEIRPNKAKESLRDHYDLAVMSKKLATICTECPVSFEREKAILGELYTPEAYEIFRRLDFKNLLSRFETQEEQEVEIRHIEDLNQAEEIFQQAGQSAQLGIQLIMEEGKLIGAGLAWEEKKAVYLEIKGFLTEVYVLQRLEGLLSGTLKISFMDVKQALAKIRIPEDDRIFDVEVAAYLLNPLKSSYTYDDIAKEYGKTILPPEEMIFTDKKKKKLVEQPEETKTLGACMAYAAFVSRKGLEEQLREKEMENLYRKIEMPLVYTLFDMEQAGIRVDAEELQAYGNKLQVRIDALEQEIWELAGENFNINSPKQLGVILFEHMKLPGGKKTKTGYSTAADVLEKLATDHPVVEKILEYRQLTKLKSTYADGLVSYIREDGRIHSTFQQKITATGRISSTEPNLQNIPIRMELGRMIRKVFLPEEGYLFLDADYSQIELRVLAHMSGDQRLIQAYREARDIHAITASEVFHIPYDEVTPLQRRNAKAVNFGIVYGISSFGLSQDLSITRKEAQEYIEKYFATYPGIKEFLDRLVVDAKEQGYVSTIFGRRRPVPELKASNFMQRAFGERVAMNSPIQGTAADIIKIAMIRVNQRLKKENLRSRLILQVHDELLIEVHREEVTYVSKLLEEEMKGAVDLAVALEVDMHTGENWYEAK